MSRRTIYRIVFSCCTLLLTFGCDTPGNVESPDKKYFMKIYGGDGDQTGVDMSLTEDGNILMLGVSELSGVKKILLIKVDPEGKIIWERTYGGTTDVAHDLEPIGNGNYVILSTFINPVDNFTDIKLIRIRSDGSKIDSVMYGTSKNDDGKTVTPLADGGFVVTGSTKFDPTDDPTIDPDPFSNIFHYRCDANLAFLESAWTKYRGAALDFDWGVKTFQEQNRFYVFASSNRINELTRSTKVKFQYYLIDEFGIPNSPAYIEDNAADITSAFATQVPAQLGSGFLVVGTKTTNPGDENLFVSKFNVPVLFTGEKEDRFGYIIGSGNRRIQAVSATSCLAAAPTGFIILGNELGTISSNIWLTKINQEGRLQWSVTLGSQEENDLAAAVQELPDGRIMVLGTLGIRDNQSKMALFKLNSTGRLQE